MFSVTNAVSIRDNILCGAKMDEERYDTVLSASGRVAISRVAS